MPGAGQLGCLADATASQATGALSTGIGFGINSVFGPPTDKNFTPTAVLTAARIGAGTAGGIESPAYAAKVITVSVNSSGAAIADGAAMPAGGLNRSGKPCPVGGMVCAVAP